MKKLYFIPILLILSACASNDVKTQYITNEKLKIIKPSEAMYNCPTIKTFPNPDNLDDIHVAKLILQLYQNNMICKNSIDTIKKFLDNAEKEISKS